MMAKSARIVKKNLREAEETKALVRRLNDIRDLLAEFRLILGSYDPGIQAYEEADPRGVDCMLDFGAREWAWLELLLIELRNRRKRVGD